MKFTFHTAPKVKSDKVIQLLASGKSVSLLEAFNSEKKDIDSSTGRSKDGKITVKRIGYLMG